MKSRFEILENKLAYGRGLNSEEWKECIELRKENILRRGMNPDDFNLGSRKCTRRY